MLKFIKLSNKVVEKTEFYTCKNCGAEFPSAEIRLYCKVCKSNLDKTGNLPKV
ncbi:MAG: hypothetical protein OEL56_01465 [Nitrosopumilus sp.]|nr:hypothetical protein [Nitrosopumilus sp.]MDH3515219.1 hypothetical protein [Nitrosopumilus sp.]MDH3564480.1 hypothetical protein [Nitrosopumilus sp.]MDH5418014.1 hypothetical protein [Nitrosopumilus sp.]MDH5554312.1 hypothetical protein [Nitrosopumilus sp.]